MVVQVLEFTKMVKGLGDADKKGGGTETTADYPPNPVLQIPLPVRSRATVCLPGAVVDAPHHVRLLHYR
jgi:hypothetical protein